MEKILEGINKIKEKWLALSRNKKIVLVVLFLAFLSAAIYFGISSTKTKYGVLFSKMDTKDSASVIEKLKSDKVPYKVDSGTNTIYVPADKVDDLRLQYTSVIKSGSAGFELFDTTSQFGMTDKQYGVTYQRAIQGELERTIKSFPQVENAKVQLVIPEDSVFVQDSNPSKASVYLQMKAGQSLSKAQVKAIMSLVAGGVKNLSTQNIQIIDDNMQLLSDDVNNDNSSNISETAQTKNQAQSQKESELQKKVLSQLEPIYGSGKVKVQVHAEMNFDATQQKTIEQKNPVVVSEHTVKEYNGTTSSSTSSSPVDSNVNTNSVSNSTTNSTNGLTRDEVTRNYDTTKVETNTVVSPGSVKRLTVSVVVNKKINQQTQDSVNNIVSQAVGLDAQRGDTISVEGLTFDTSSQTAAQKAIDEMNKEKQEAQKQKLIMYASIAGVALVAAVIAFIIIRRRKKDEEEIEDTEEHVIDTVVGDEDVTDTKPQFAPIDFEQENENNHMEKEIRKYASTKPDQVADVIKSWLTEDEG